MLNELRDLAQSLEKAGVVQEDLHPLFKQCPKGGLSFWLYLDCDGNIQDIALIETETVTKVRKWERANGVSFPAFNVPPLFEPDGDEDKEKIKAAKKLSQKGSQIDFSELKTIISKSTSLWSSSIIKKINDCLSKPVQEVKELLDTVPDRVLSIKELCRRTVLLSTDKLYSQLEIIFLKKFVDIPALAPDILEALFFYTGKSVKNFQVLLEIKDWSSNGYEYPANHQEVQKWMNKRFLENSESKKDTISDGSDAYGESSLGVEEKFPPVRLAVLGNVILRAMNKESPCQTRYGMIDSDSFPAGNKVRMEMKSALEWLSKEERKGKTWCDLSKNIDKSALLFAYPTEIPELAPELAGLFGTADEDGSDPDRATFSAIAERVTGTLKGRAAGRLTNEVRIFVLAKMDKARTKVLVSRRYTAEHTIEAADNWQSGCRNIPPIKIRQFGEKMGDKPVWADYLIPFPAELVLCLNTAWRRQGTYAEAVHGFTINDALNILLDDAAEVQRLAGRAIDSIVRNSTPLLLSVGQENILGKVFKVNQKYAKQPLLLPSILGLMLYKIGYKKGGFMNAPAFLVGQFLSLADQLHLKYCEHVRKGSIPPQLVGNALMPTALEEPVKALSMLSQRILPYQAWANTLREGEDIGLIRYFLGQLGEVSGKLKELDIPAQCFDADKAQMLLGYLARAEKTND